MIPDKETRDIQAYLNDTLPQSRRTAFELKLQNDPLFKQKVDDLRPIFEVFEEMKLEEKIKAIIKKSEITAVQKEDEIVPKTTTKLQSRFGNFIKYGIAALLLVFLGITWHDLTLSSKLFQDYYTTEIESSRGGNVDNCPDETTMRSYYQGDYQLFLQKLEQQSDNSCKIYYKGMAFLGLGDSEKAIPYLSKAILTDEKAINQKAEWYLALAYLKNNEVDKAKEQLLKIGNKTEHQYGNLAKDLMKELENKPIIFK